MIGETMRFRVEDAARRDPGTNWKSRAVNCMFPAFGQPEGEDEHVSRLERCSDGREMLLPVGAVFGLGWEAAGLDLGLNGTIHAPVSVRHASSTGVKVPQTL